MGFIDNIKRVIGNLFGTIQNPRYDDSVIIEAFQTAPKSMKGEFRAQIQSIIDEIHQVYTTANCRHFTIGVIGDFSVGKSSFVNAFLGENIVPVSANPSTAIITKIQYGSKAKAVVHYENGNNNEMSYEDFLNFSAFNLDDFRERDRTGRILRFNDVADATIYVKSKFLKNNNLCLIDTLGLSSHENDNKRTIASIKDAVALIYICDERGLSSKDVGFISTYLDLGRENLFFCINRIDLVTRKDERQEVTKLVRLKLDDILLKKGFKTTFQENRIFQVSSLYQYFANGFIDHERWREGIDYQSRSGFVPLMNELSEYVKNNALAARKNSIVRQLEVSNEQIIAIKRDRKCETNKQINTIQKDIQVIVGDIKRFEDKVSYMESLFGTLEQTIYSILQGIYKSLSKEVNSHWDYRYRLIDKVSFGFGDYLCLEKDLCALKLNIFKSMSDDRYSQLKSISPFVDLTFQYIYDALIPIFNLVRQHVSSIIEDFCKTHSLCELMERRNGTGVVCAIFEQPTNYNLLGIKNAMYRAVAEIAVESTWVKESNRKRKMFDAAKDEALKAIENPLKNLIEDMFQVIKIMIKGIFDDSVYLDKKRIYNLKRSKSDKEQSIASLNNAINEEVIFCEKISGVIKSMYESV